MRHDWSTADATVHGEPVQIITRPNSGRLYRFDGLGAAAAIKIWGSSNIIVICISRRTWKRFAASHRTCKILTCTAA
ncbi:MAG: hypothetical protein R2911_44865 [Caldilineaceae bacterium]